MNAPCKGCTERAVGCHNDSCPKWKAYRTEHDRIKENRRKELTLYREYKAMRENAFKKNRKGGKYGY